MIVCLIYRSGKESCEPWHAKFAWSRKLSCLCVFKWTLWYSRVAIASPRDSSLRERERREKERDEWERQYGRQSHSPSPSKYGKITQTAIWILYICVCVCLCPCPQACMLKVKDVKYFIREACIRFTWHCFMLWQFNGLWDVVACYCSDHVSSVP